jgi:MerR family transcriptional regulator, light-induced transcriptional regulator
MTDGRLASNIGGKLSRAVPHGFRVEFEPPIKIEIDDSAEREERLASLVAEKVVPRLLAIHDAISYTAFADAVHAGEQEVAELSRLVLGPDNGDALNYVMALRDAGLSLDKLYLELLEPTARHLGELWDMDKVDFLDVSIGLIRLQRLVRMFAGLDDIAPYDDKCRALIITTPDEQHVFGSSIVQRFFRAGGWHVCNGPVATIEDVSRMVSQEWFGVVGFSLAAEKHLDSLARSIAAVRKMSLNRSVGILVGGPAFTAHPERAVAVGADGTAANAPAAVVLAKKLLVPSLVSPG